MLANMTGWGPARIDVIAEDKESALRFIACCFYRQQESQTPDKTTSTELVTGGKPLLPCQTIWNVMIKRPVKRGATEESSQIKLLLPC